jgi:small subunit ribosomal protein S7
MRRPITKKHTIKPDHRYGSEELEKFINNLMLDGKKTVARAVVYGALDEIAKREKTDNPLQVFADAMKNIGPLVEVRSRRIGGANYQVPREVTPARRQTLATRWILDIVRGRSGRPAAQILADELIAGSKGEGDAVKKKENTHRMAEANKAFANFSW